MVKNQQVQTKKKNSIGNFLTNKEVLIAIFSTVFLLAVFQFGAHITAPSLVTSNRFGGAGSNVVALLNLLGGGGLNRVSLFAVGISPYVTAQIIIQMLSSDIVKPLVELKKSGERGRRKMELYTRILTLPFAIATAYGALVLITNANLAQFRVHGTLVSSLSEVPTTQKALLVILFVSGTYIALFIADIISKKGVGNGTTLVIMSGIIASVPRNLQAAYAALSLRAIGSASHFVGIVTFIIYLFFYLFVLLAIVFINGAVRKIPIQQTGQGLVKNANELPYLPIKLIPAGVIPVIFAGSLMAIPGTIAEFIRFSNPSGFQFIQNYLILASPVGLTIYALLIIIFSFFYSHIQVNAEELTENFQKSGRFIPGISIGQATYNHIRKVINRINWIGAPLLAIIGILPNILTIAAHVPPGAAVGGTGVIIMVSGSIQLWDAIKSTATSVKYRTQKEVLHAQITDHYDQLTAQAVQAESTSVVVKDANEPKDPKSDFVLW